MSYQDKQLGTTNTDIIFQSGGINYYVSPKVKAWGNSSTSITIDLSLGSYHTLTMTGNCTITLSNPIAGGTWVLECTQDGTGSRTIAIQSGDIYAQGVTPVASTAAAAVDKFVISYNGTSYLIDFNPGYA